jgi:hypothetical protein
MAYRPACRGACPQTYLAAFTDDSRCGRWAELRWLLSRCPAQDLWAEMQTGKGGSDALCSRTASVRWQAFVPRLTLELQHVVRRKRLRVRERRVQGVEYSGS